MTPDEFRDDYTYRSAFLDYGLRCEPVEGFRGEVAFTIDNIADVILCCDIGASYESDLHVVVRLDDGRFAYMLNSCCSCGFSSEGQAWVTDDYDALIQFGVGADGLASLPDLPRSLDELALKREFAMRDDTQTTMEER